jgi:hypothetical protein
VVVGANSLEDHAACCCLQVQNGGSTIPPNVGASLLNCVPTVIEDHTVMYRNLPLSSDLEQEPIK